LTSRKAKLINHALTPQGTLLVDDGATRALLDKSASLFAAGILEVEGTFVKGALVKMVTRSGREIGRGLTNFSAPEVLAFMKESQMPPTTSAPASTSTSASGSEQKADDDLGQTVLQSLSAAVVKQQAPSPASAKSSTSDSSKLRHKPVISRHNFIPSVTLSDLVLS